MANNTRTDTTPEHFEALRLRGLQVAEEMRASGDFAEVLPSPFADMGTDCDGGEHCTCLREPSAEEYEGSHFDGYFD